MEDVNHIEMEELISNLPSIIKLKTEGNSFFSKNDYDNAIEFYNQAKDIIKTSDLKLKEESYTHILEKNENKELIEFKDSLKKENISIHSNLALCYMKKNMYQESIDHDLKIVTHLDPLFDKSYIRLIQNYLNLDKLDNAVYYYLFIKNQFNNETLTKYTDVLIKLETENKKFSEQIKLMKKKNNSHNNKSYSNYTYIIALVLVGLAWYFYQSKKNVEEQVF